MAKLAFVDIETTGLHHNSAIWEIAIIADDVEYIWQQTVSEKDLLMADKEALKITNFKERYKPEQSVEPWASAKFFGELLKDRFIVGIVPSFDDIHLSMEYKKFFGKDRTWKYQLIDAEVFAQAVISQSGPPFIGDKIYSRLNIDISNFTIHNALDDARLAKAVYEAALAYNK